MEIPFSEQFWSFSCFQLRVRIYSAEGFGPFVGALVEVQSVVESSDASSDLKRVGAMMSDSVVSSFAISELEAWMVRPWALQTARWGLERIRDWLGRRGSANLGLLCLLQELVVLGLEQGLGTSSLVSGASLHQKHLTVSEVSQLGLDRQTWLPHRLCGHLPILWLDWVHSDQQLLYYEMWVLTHLSSLRKWCCFQWSAR